MKKTSTWIIIVLFVIVVCQIAFCGQDFFNLSPDALRLNKEQKNCYTIFECFFGAYVFRDIEPLMASTLKKDMNIDNFNNLKSSLQKAFGNLKNPRFSTLQKVNQFDRIVYLAEGPNNTVFEVIYVFTTENQSTLLTEFAVRPIQAQQVTPQVVPPQPAQQQRR